MSSMNPIVLMTIPVQFEDLKKKSDIDLSELGIENKRKLDEYDPDHDCVENLTIQVDRVTGYTVVKTKSGNEYVLIYVDGIKWWVHMSFNRFDKLYREKVEEFNQKLKEYI
jgi:hypothetical protein